MQSGFADKERCSGALAPPSHPLRRDSRTPIGSDALPGALSTGLLAGRFPVDALYRPNLCIFLQSIHHAPKTVAFFPLEFP
jgi:hypothetical protein